MKRRQIPAGERIESVERLIVFGFLAIITFNAITENKTYFFGKNIIILNLTVFFVCFPSAIYYFTKIIITASRRLGESYGRLGERLGESVGSYIQEHKPKLRIPFFLSLVLLSVLIAYYLLGKNMTDIIYSILLIFIGWSLNIVSTKKEKTISDYSKL